MPPHLPLAYRVLRPPNPAALLPATRRDVREWLHQQARLRAHYPVVGRLPEAAFPYQDLPASVRLSYELVDWDNFSVYLALFGSDPSPFVDARFKERTALESYAVDLLLELRHSWKRGAADWLVRRRPDNQPLGVLHLYDLSQESLGDGRVPPCAVGYALAAPFRRQSYGTEALQHLLAQAAALFGRTEARALSVVDNLASQALLRKVGFVVLEERPATHYQEATLLWQRRLT